MPSNVPKLSHITTSNERFRWFDLFEETFKVHFWTEIPLRIIFIRLRRSVEIIFTRLCDGVVYQSKATKPGTAL